MKKNKLFISLFILMILPVLYFTGCNKHDEITSPNEFNYDSPQYAIIDYNDLLNGVEDATLDNEMVCSNSLYSYGFINMPSFVQGNVSGMMSGGMMSIAGGGGNWIIKFDWAKHLGILLRRLNLTDAQKGQVKDALTAFHAAMKPLVKEFHDANADIIKTANEARKAILDKVKAGTLSRADAKKQLDDLNKATRDNIANNPASKAVQQKMCDERKKLFTAIESILDASQLTKWKDAIAKFPDPCK